MAFASSTASLLQKVCIMIDPSIVVRILRESQNTHFFPELKNGDISRVGSFNNFWIKNDFTFIVLIGPKQPITPRIPALDKRTQDGGTEVPTGLGERRRARNSDPPSCAPNVVFPMGEPIWTHLFAQFLFSSRCSMEAFTCAYF